MCSLDSIWQCASAAYSNGNIESIIGAIGSRARSGGETYIKSEEAISSFRPRFIVDRTEIVCGALHRA